MEIRLLKMAAWLFVTRTRRAIKQRILGKRPLATAPALADKNLLFICGLHRSGTSILNRLLREHADVTGFTMTGAVEDEGQHLQSVIPRDYHYGGHGVFAFDLAAHLTENSPLNTRENRERLLREWCAYYDLSKRVYVEKSPPNIVRSRFLQALAPTTRFVFIVRHPIAVALASRRSMGASIILLMTHWHVAHAIMQRDLPFIHHSIVLRYEDLVARPQACLDRICDLAELDHFTPRESIVDHNAKYFAEWEAERSEYEWLLGDLFAANQAFLQAMGYSLTEPYVLPGAPAGTALDAPGPASEN